MLYVGHIIMLHTLNFYSAVGQLHLNKTGRKRKEFWFVCCCCFKFILFIYFWRYWVFVAAHGLSLVGVSGATLCCGARASHCGGFSCCGARALGAQASAVAARRLSSCGSWALERRLSSCGARA